MSNETSKFKEQERLIAKSVRSGVPLSEVLASVGWNYDDLVYRESRLKRWKGGRALALGDLALPSHGTPVVSFFTGCGGMDLGFEAAGFEHVAAFEINELACKTLRKNRPNWKVFGPPTHSGDVSNFESASEALNEFVDESFEGVFIGGPPCQPFSIAANQRFRKDGDNFKRTGFANEKNGNLLFDYLNLVLKYRPAVFVVENVPGLRDIDDGEQLRTAIRRVQAAGYSVVDPFVLDASAFGVPQQRHRLFVIGTRLKGTFTPPEPVSRPYGAGSTLRIRRDNAENYETREHKSESVLRYMRLDYGERDQLGRVDRLDPTLPSKTVIAGGTNGGGRSHLHPEIPRTLSVRECARLQTFPDDFVFVGPSARQFTQVGNAVPPVLAAQIGRSIKDSFF